MQDFEVDALIPCFISSVTAYSFFSSVYGFSRIFDTPQYTFTNPLNLFFYAALGLLIAPFIIGYTLEHSIGSRIKPSRG
ncbi:MAG: chloride channel protein [Nitrososphaeria archaeon]